MDEDQSTPSTSGQDKQERLSRGQTPSESIPPPRKSESTPPPRKSETESKSPSRKSEIHEPESIPPPPEPPRPPDGVESVFLTGTTLQIIGIDDKNPLSLIDMKVIMDDIQFRGAISDFHPIKDKLLKYSGEQVLLRLNDNDKYGDQNNFEVCVTLEAKAAVEKEAADAQKAELEESQALSEDKVIKTKPEGWVSLGSDKEIEEASVRPTRDQITLSISRKRREFGSSYKFSDKDSQELWNSSQMECRPFKDPSFEKRRIEHEIGVQAKAATIDTAVQTIGARPRNNASQYSQWDLEPKEKEQLLTCPEMTDFLRAVKPRYEEALQQNEVMDIFQDDFASLAEDEGGGLGAKTAGALSEYQSFTDLTYSKGKCVSAIDWLPNRKGVIAVAYTEPLSFEERVEVAGRVRNSAVLIWNFIDPIHPQLVLESSSDVFCLRFNPARPELIAGGCYNGQVVLWDTSSLQEAMLKREKRSDEETSAEKENSIASIPVIRQALVSALEGGHSHLVSDLQWLPNALEVEPKGKLWSSKMGETNTFATIAVDGKVMFWDSRGKRNKKGGGEEVLWTPTFEIRLLRPEGSGDFGALRMDLSRLSEKNPYFFCCSEDGEVLYARVAPSEAPDAASADVSSVLSVSPAHCGPVRALARSPFFDDVILSVGDWTFKVWREGMQKPIFASACADTYLTAAAWSPSRPGVIFTGLQDGSVAVWDLLDRSHEPSISSTVSPATITSMEFWTHSVPQLLAVGDSAGVLHIMEVPRNLRRSLPKEKAAMRNFFDREAVRVEYVEKRAKVRTLEAGSAHQQNPETQVPDKEVDESLHYMSDAGADERMEVEYQKLEKAFRAKLGIVAPEEGLDFPQPIRASVH